MYQFKTLEDISMHQLANCFNDAFSDYEQNIHFNEESLRYYLDASQVDLSLSFGAFFNNQLIGFILNSKGIYQEEKVVFDAGTGIVPSYRHQKVFTKLFEYTCTQLKKHQIKKYYLEVLQSNTHALSIYQKVGFQIAREYVVLVASGSKDKMDDVKCCSYLDFETFDTKHSVLPSYEQTTDMIHQQPSFYEVLYLSEDAYIIYAKRHRGIIQIHYNDLSVLKKIITTLIHQYPRSMAKNIDVCYGDVITLLKECGYVETFLQYEMMKEL